MTTQSREDLLHHLVEQLGFLRVSGAAFDGGSTAEAKRLATHIRILVYEKLPNSVPLLGQLGVRDSLRFVDTSHPPTAPGEYRFDFGLAAATMGPQFYVAMGGDADRQQPKPFETWWRGTVLTDQQQNRFSRESLVLGLAHKDGGAHIDPDLGAAYAALSRSNSLGFEFTAGDVRIAPQSPVPANVRQIAIELQLTIEEQLGNLLAQALELIDPAPDRTTVTIAGPIFTTTDLDASAPQ